MLLLYLVAPLLGVLAAQSTTSRLTTTSKITSCSAVKSGTKTITACATISTSSLLPSSCSVVKSGTKTITACATISTSSSVRSSCSAVKSGTKTITACDKISTTSSSRSSSQSPTTSSSTTRSTSSTTTSSASATKTTAGSSSIAISASNTILIIARDSKSAYSASSVLNGYGIPYQILLVPQTGAALPTLNSTDNLGNFGAIVVLSEVGYAYPDAGFISALTAAQWKSLYTYQTSFGVRMVRLDVYPSPQFGTLAQGGCCGFGQEQFISISNSKDFATAGLKTGATMSTKGLYHYPATITDNTIATEFIQFGTTTEFTKISTAGVINNIAGRQQMVFFINFATDWSPTSNFLSHAWIQWATRGLYAGYRRVNLGTQVDDMFLDSDIYYPPGNHFRIRTSDMDAIKSWTATVNRKLNNGSDYFVEIGHNGNGNIEAASAASLRENICSGGAVQYKPGAATDLEFQKELGSGTNIWPATATQYPYSVACLDKDDLKTWFAKAENRDAFAHVSHTFTHESENNATFEDISREISWNQAWLKQVGLDTAKRFSAGGLIPPAITGLHNGDALRAWVEGGIKNVVGDNTRPALKNTQNEHWPLITNIDDNGYEGVQITPRWATNIYYNCDNADCTVEEWKDTSSGSGDIYALLDLERETSSKHLLGLHHDPFMFHQANLRQTDVSPVQINGVTSQLSLIQMWVETAVQEMVRLVNWPIISLKHDDIAAAFANRMARDQCGYKMTSLIDLKSKTITGVTVSTKNNYCSSPIPITVPGTVINTQGFVTENIGSDPLTIWVKMTGNPVTLTLTQPLAL